MTRRHDTTTKLGTHLEAVEERNVGCTDEAPKEVAMSVPVSVSASADQVARSRPSADPNASGLRKRLRFLVELVSDTLERFSDNEGYRLGAAFSYYATFSIFPLVLLSVTVVGFILGDSASAKARMLEAIATPNSAGFEVLDRALTTMQANHSVRGLSAAVAIGTLLFSASGAFVELDATLNRIWCCPERRSNGIWGSIRIFLLERLSGFAIVLGLGLALLVSLISSSFLSFLVARAREQVALSIWPAVARTAEIVASVALITGLFTAAFHLIPRSRPPLRVVAPGALVTTALFLTLKEVFASYLSHVMSYSAYGVAGGVLALATWIYLSSMIVFMGAQLTRIHAEKRGAVEICRREYRFGRIKEPESGPPEPSTTTKPGD